MESRYQFSDDFFFVVVLSNMYKFHIFEQNINDVFVSGRLQTPALDLII